IPDMDAIVAVGVTPYWFWRGAGTSDMRVFPRSNYGHQTKGRRRPQFGHRVPGAARHEMPLRRTGTQPFGDTIHGSRIGSASRRKGDVLRSIQDTEPALRALLRAHQIGEALEKIMRVARAGRGFGMVLHRENRLALELDAAVGAVEQRDVGLRRAFWQGFLVDGKAVVHRGDFHLAGGLVLDRMIGAVMALMHLHGFGADREAEHLMAQTDSKRRRARIDHLLD